MTTEKKTYLSAATLVVLTIFLIGFLIYPSFKTINQMSEEIKRQEQNLVLLEKKIENLEQFKTIYRNLETFLKELDNLFVNPEVPVEFIGFLEKESREAGIEMEISPASLRGSQNDPWPSLTFQVETRGSFPQFLRFFEKLENSPYLIKIESLNISQVEKTASIKSIFSIKVYTK